MRHYRQLLCIYLIFLTTQVKGVIFLQFSEGSNITEALQRQLINAKNGQTIQFPKGHFLINHLIRVNNKKKLTIVGNNSHIKMQDNTPLVGDYGMFEFRNCTNLNVSQLILDANRSNRIPKEVPAHSFSLLSCKNVTLSQVVCLNNVVDGFYFATATPEDSQSYCSNIQMNYCKALFSFRNGLSIINAYNVTVTKGEFSFSQGTLPEAGIDVESNEDEGFPGCKNITFRGVTCAHNKGNGLMIASMGSPKYVHVMNCKIHHCLNGIFATGVYSKLTGNVISNCKEAGIFVIRYAHFPEDHTCISKNVISQCSDGISYLGFGGKIEGNQCNQNRRAGLLLSGKTLDITSATVRDNSFSHNHEGIQSDGFNQADLVSNHFLKNFQNGVKITHGKLNLKNNSFIGGKSGVLNEEASMLLQGNHFSELNDALLFTNEVNETEQQYYIRNNSFHGLKGKAIEIQ